MATLIKRGHKGSYVADIQIMLNNHARLSFSAYGPLVEDGDFGKKTKERVEEWQMFNGLKVDGIVGPNTWFKMFQDTMPVAVVAAADAVAKAVDAGIAGLPKIQPYYLHDHDVPGSGKVAARHKGQSHWMATIAPADLSRIAGTVSAEFENKSDRVTELFLNCHGGSAGVLVYGHKWFHMDRRNDMEQLLSAFQSRMAPNAMTYILACNFSTASTESDWFDYTFKTPMELLEGPGSRAVAQIARYLRTSVRAGFGLQRGDLGDIIGLGLQSDQFGNVRYIFDGRDRSADELFNEYKKGVKDGLGQVKKKLKPLFEFIGMD